MKSVEHSSEDLKCGFLGRPPLTLWDCLFLCRPGNWCLTAGGGVGGLRLNLSSLLSETCGEEELCHCVGVTASTGQRIQINKLLPDQLVKPRTGAVGGGGWGRTLRHTHINNMQQGEQEPGQDSWAVASCAAVCPRGPDPVRTGGDSGWRVVGPG